MAVHLLEYAGMRLNESPPGIRGLYEKGTLLPFQKVIRLATPGLHLSYVFDREVVLTRFQLLQRAPDIAFTRDHRIAVKYPPEWQYAKTWGQCPACGTRVPHGPGFFVHYDQEHAQFPGVLRPGHHEALIFTTYRDPLASLNLD